MRRFDEAGLLPKTRFGQNFLIDLNLLDLLYRSAELRQDDVVLEVGTGTGSLTAMMARDAAAVVSVEVDPHLFQLASEELERLDNVTLLMADALKNKNRFNPDVMDAVRDRLSAAEGRVFKLAANLPYNIATPVISNALAGDPPPQSMTVTIQKELADRLVAPPSTKDYGSLSVWVQCQCDVRLVRVMPPEAFWPRPKVSSAIVHAELNEAKRGRIRNLPFFHKFIRAMFLHRRKFLRSVALSAFKGQLNKPEVDAVLSGQGLSGQERAEQLDVERLIALGQAFETSLA